MLKLAGFIVLLMGAQFAFAGSSVKVLSKNDIGSTQSRYMEALKEADVPIRATKEIEEQLPGGFSRKVKEIEFSNPYYGWNLGECHRGERKDKPLTARIWKDNQERVWLEYTAPAPVVNKFGVIECGNEVDLVTKSLMKFADTATE